jgi:tetratricopeptide (TPR) repeat protein
VKLTEGELAGMRARGTDNLEAYLKASEASEYWNRWTKDDNLKARQIAEEVIALDPNYDVGYILLGGTYWISVVSGWDESPRESLKKAFDLVQKAITLDDNRETSHRLLACVYQTIGQPDKAIAEFERAVAVAPNSSNALAGLGYGFNQIGKSREAVKPLETAFALDPFPPSWFFQNLGFAYLCTGKINETIEVCNKAISVFPSRDDTHELLGAAFIMAGKPEEALGEFDEALSLNRHPPSLYIGNRAVALVNAGRSEEALTSMNDLVSRSPDDADGYWFFSQVLTLLGRHAEALQMAKRGASLPRGPSAHSMVSLGLPYLMLEQYDQAILHFKEFIKLYPDLVYERIGLAASYSLAGRMEEARAETLDVLKINPKISLDDIARNGYLNYKTADKDRIIDALRNAGLK